MKRLKRMGKDLDLVIARELEAKAKNYSEREFIYGEEINDFMQTMTPIAFLQFNLSLEKHYHAALTVSNILLSQMKKSDEDFDDHKTVIKALQIIDREDYEGDNMQLAIGFGQYIFFSRGFYPSSFKVKPVAQSFYARKAFQDIGEELKFKTYPQIAEFFEEYVASINYLKEMIRKDKKELIRVMPAYEKVKERVNFSQIATSDLGLERSLN